MHNWQEELKNLANCSVTSANQGRFEDDASPHQSCHHFNDARDFYGPLHVINWMRSDRSFDSDAYAEQCGNLGIGTADERQEFLDKTFRKR